MFGQNPIRSADYADPSKLAIEETFYTIQGEGPFAGRPAIFIRLAGCNLACTFCDTQFETMAEQSRDVDEYLDWFFKEFTEDQQQLVVITGGEPLRQNLDHLLSGLLNELSSVAVVQIETAGTLWQPDYEQGPNLSDLINTEEVVLVCSPKTPKVHPEIEKQCLHWKYVIKAGETDSKGIPNRSTQLIGNSKARSLFFPSRWHMNVVIDDLPFHDTIWVSPCDEYDGAKNRANVEAVRDIALKHGYWVSLQTHKILGVA